MFSPREADQSACMCGQFILCDRAFALRRAELHACYEAAEVLIAFASFRKEWIAHAGCGSHFGADMCLNAGFFSREMESRRTVNTIAIEECHCGQFISRARAGEFFGQRGAFKEAEGGGSMQFNVRRAQS